jgi:glutamine cyclotransferase
MIRRCFALAAVFLVLTPFSTASAAPLRICGYAIRKTFPHDPAAFTEGLVYDDGNFLESTGLVGSSTIRRVRIQDGHVLQRTTVAPPHFGEGIVRWKNDIVSVTWQGGRGFRWDAKSLRKTGTFAYTGEGWGLTHDGRHLILSDGTPVLRFLDPVTLKVKHTITVTVRGQPLRNINELEWVKGQIYANVWMTDQIVTIDPQSGVVGSVIDLTGMRQLAGARDADAVPNGIAYDAKGDRLFVTGKYWSRVFQINLRGC